MILILPSDANLIGEGLSFRNAEKDFDGFRFLSFGKDSANERNEACFKLPSAAYLLQR